MLLVLLLAAIITVHSDDDSIGTEGYDSDDDSSSSDEGICPYVFEECWPTSLLPPGGSSSDDSSSSDGGGSSIVYPSDCCPGENLMCTFICADPLDCAFTVPAARAAAASPPPELLPLFLCLPFEEICQGVDVCCLPDSECPVTDANMKGQRALFNSNNADKNMATHSNVHSNVHSNDANYDITISPSASLLGNIYVVLILFIVINATLFYCFCGKNRKSHIIRSSSEPQP